MSFLWTDERVSKLKQLWADGMSCSLIAAHFGCGGSRSAVIGKVHRLGLSGRKLASPRTNLPRNPTVRRKRNHRDPLLIPPRVAAPAINLDEDALRDLPPENSDDQVTLLDAREGHCRWPIGEPGSAEFRFCGTAQYEGSSYCLRHRERSISHPRPVSAEEHARRIAWGKQLARIAQKKKAAALESES